MASFLPRSRNWLAAPAGLFGLLFAGCLDLERAPLPGPVERTQVTSILTLSAGAVTENSDLVNIAVGKLELKPTVTTGVVSARSASYLTTTDLNTGQHSSRFVVRYREHLQEPDKGVLRITISNVSQRAFSLSGVVIRAESTAASVSMAYPEDVFNVKRLAPGEAMAIDLSLTGIRTLTANDNITVHFYEMPERLAADGAVAVRGSASAVFMISAQDQTMTMKEWSVEEQRAWTDADGCPPDLRPFLSSSLTWPIPVANTNRDHHPRTSHASSQSFEIPFRIVGARGNFPPGMHERAPRKRSGRI